MEHLDFAHLRLMPKPPESVIFPHIEEMYTLIQDMVEASIDNNPVKGDETLAKMLQFIMTVSDSTYVPPNETPSGARFVQAGYVMLPRNREEALSMVRVGMHYLENQAPSLSKTTNTENPEKPG